MSTITLPNIRVSSDLTVSVRLKDNGVAIDWSTLNNVKASIYSDAQRALAGRCDVSVDAEDPTVLVCQYAANKPQYVGVCRIVVSAKYMGETKTYDKPAFNFVRWTADQDGEQITIDDPDVDVEIEVSDVSSSLLDEAIRAAFTAAEEAVDAKGHVLETEAEVEAAEALRVSAEESRVEAEEGRAEAEAARVEEEAVRVSAEDARVVAENARAAAEDLREGAEDDRAAAETARETAEAARVAAEALRVTAEGSRETAEAAREAQASADHTVAAGDHTQAAADHTQAAADHTTAASDHTQAGADHTLAAADHVTAGEDHAQAQDDHEVMEGYDTRLGSVESEVSQLEAKVTELDAEVLGGTFSPGLTWSDGYIQATTGKIAASTASKFTQPFVLKKGQKVTIGTNNSNIGIICTTNADSLAVGDTVTVLQRTTSAGVFETYSYVATQDIRIVLCVKWSDYSLSFSVDNGLMGRVEGLETNAESFEVEIEGLENVVNNLMAEVDGGNKFYVNKAFDINDKFINYTRLYVELEEPLSEFYYKFITPEDVAINEFGVRVWDEDGNEYQYPASVSPNEEGHWTPMTYKVTKFAINSVSPDVKYTGTFKIQLYKKIVFDGLELQVNGGDVVVGKKIVDADNEYVNYNNTACSLLAPVRSFRMKLSVPDGTSITKYSIYVYESDNTNHFFGDFTPGIEQTFSDKGYEVTKIAVASLTPDARYTGTFVLEVVEYYESPLARKASVNASLAVINEKLNYDDRETIPAYYFENDYLPNKVAFIRDLLEGCSANGDAFFFQTDEHWEMNAQHSPALVKYIADRLNISRLFDGGDTTHNIDANGFYHLSPEAIDFNRLRDKTYNGRIFHTIGNHEYLTWGFSDIDQYSGVDFGNWHDFAYFTSKGTGQIVIGDNDKHYYYVDNLQKKVRYIVLSSYKKKEQPIQSGTKYYSIAEYDYSAEQLLWFENTALDVEDGWTVIVFSHNFIGYNHGDRDGEGYIESVAPYVPEAVKPFAQAILQYDGNGVIAGVFAGHWHSDALLVIDDTLAGLSSGATGKTFPCIVTTCDAYNFNGLGEEERLYNRTVDTITEQAFDVVILDKTARKFTLVRIGGRAYNILVQAPNGKYPLFGDFEYREVTY